VRAPAALALAAALLAAIGGCSVGAHPAAPRIGNDPMRALLESTPALARVTAKAAHYRLQGVLGRIEPGPGGRPTLVQDGFRAGAEYFYPASSVKLFGAVAALERLHEIARESGLPITVDTPMVYHPLFADDTLEAADPANVETGKLTVRQEIRKIFLVSDNQAFNHLYELVGQERLAAMLARAGIHDAWIVHRLSEFRTAEENRRYPRIDFVGEGFTYTLPERTSAPLPPPPPIPGLEVGEAYLDDDTKLDHPMDFSGKNRVPLVELQRGLCMVVRPDVDCGGPGFAELDAADRQLILEAMREFPRQSKNPVYPETDFPDDYVKFTLPGVLRVLPRDEPTIYDKVGDAYGFMIDNSYYVDDRVGHPFFLAAELYANDDGVLNDDHYDYDTVSRPFLADLGEAAVRAIWPAAGKR